MGATILVDDLYSTGKSLLEQLDRSGVNFPAAFLANLSDDDYAWTLVIAMEGVRKNGSRHSYQKILDVITANNIPFSLADVKVIDVEDKMVKGLRRRVNTGKDLEKISFFANYVNGDRFPDAIVYRSL